MNGFIYKITNEINDKVYIGKTLHSSIEQRFAEHCNDALKELENKRPLYSAMRKYGVDKFHIELIEEVSLELLSEREIYWIKYYNAYGAGGYNATLGEDGKQLYDYNAIVHGFLNGKMVKELANEFECCTDTILNALHLAKVDVKTIVDKSKGKSLRAKDKEGKIIQEFASRSEAVEWLQANKYTISTNKDNITATIGRAANGKRATAYGMIWENI